MKSLQEDPRHRAVSAVYHMKHSIRGVNKPDFFYMMKELEKACLRTADWNRIADFPFFIQQIEGVLE